MWVQRCRRGRPSRQPARKEDAMSERGALHTALFVLIAVGLNGLVVVGWVMVTSMMGSWAMPGFGSLNGAPTGSDWTWGPRATVGLLIMLALWGVLHAGLTSLVRGMLKPSASANRHVATGQQPSLPRRTA